MSEPDARALARVLSPVAPAKPSALKRLATLAATIPRAADLVLLGDSLAASWPADLLAEAAPGRRIWNFGLPGDRIQNTLWRLGAVDTAHLRPELCLLLLGTNNLGDGDAARAIVAGLAAVLDRIDNLWHAPATLVMTIPYREDGPARRDADRTCLNALLLRDLARPESREIVDADAVLGRSPADRAACLEQDRVHLGHEGYRRLNAELARWLAAAPAGGERGEGKVEV